jgi:hypothetical protein
VVEALPGHRLHRIAPDLSKLHATDIMRDNRTDARSVARSVRTPRGV